MNKFIGTGYIGKKGVELKFSNSGKAVATYTLNILRAYQSGDKKEYDFLPCVSWGKAAEFIANNEKNIKKVLIEGRVQTRNYKAQDGSTRYVTEIITENIEVIEWNGQAEQHNNTGYGDFTPVEDDSLIPF